MASGNFVVKDVNKILNELGKSEDDIIIRSAYIFEIEVDPVSFPVLDFFKSVVDEITGALSAIQ